MEGSEYFDSHSDGLNAEGQVPAQTSSLLWSGGSAQTLPHRSESTHAISVDPLRQNIYENFMRELEMSRSNTEHVETSTETMESSSESVSSLEQLDLLFEKEQGVVRKAGWLFFKPLVTLQKERKLELVARRKWKQYWVTLKGTWWVMLAGGLFFLQLSSHLEVLVGSAWSSKYCVSKHVCTCTCVCKCTQTPEDSFRCHSLGTICLTLRFSLSLAENSPMWLNQLTTEPQHPPVPTFPVLGV
jgi:hypothetical protein